MKKKPTKETKQIKIDIKPKIVSPIRNIDLKIRKQKQREFPSIFKQKESVENNDEEFVLENIIQNANTSPVRISNLRVNPNLEMTNDIQNLEIELRDVPTRTTTADANINQPGYAMKDNYAAGTQGGNYIEGEGYPKIIGRTTIPSPTMQGSFTPDNPFSTTSPGFKSSDRMASNEYPDGDATRSYDSLDMQKTDRRRDF